MRGWPIVLILMLLAGCADEPASGADPVTTTTTTETTAPAGTPNETQEQITYALLMEATFRVQAGNEAACSMGPAGYYADTFSGGQNFHGVDYDLVAIDPAWVAAAVNLTVTSSGEAVLAWLDEGGAVIDAARVDPGETFAGEVPEGAHGAGFVSCSPSAAEGHLVIHESEAMFTRSNEASG